MSPLFLSCWWSLRMGVPSRCPPRFLLHYSKPSQNCLKTMKTLTLGILPRQSFGNIIPWQRGFITRGPGAESEGRECIQARDNMVELFYSPSVPSIGFRGTVVKAVFCLARSICLPGKRFVHSTVVMSTRSSSTVSFLMSSSSSEGSVLP